MKTHPNPSVRAIAGIVCMFSLLPGSGSSAQVATTPVETAAFPIPVVTRFENFGEKDGLPSHKVHSVLKTRDGKLWLGTNNGLCLREADGQFHTYGTKDGLSHPTVLWMAEDPGTADVKTITLSYTFFHSLDEAARSGKRGRADDHGDWYDHRSSRRSAPAIEPEPHRRGSVRSFVAQRR